MDTFRRSEPLSVILGDHGPFGRGGLCGGRTPRGAPALPGARGPFLGWHLLPRGGLLRDGRIEGGRP